MAIDFKSLDILQLSTYSGGWYKVQNIADAESFTTKLATSHYENFPVASVLIPKNLRQHILNIYAFARTADDIADTLLELSTQQRINILKNYLNNLKVFADALDAPQHNKPFFNPTLLAAANTIKKLQLPLTPFEKLVKAFEMDSDFRQADSFSDLHCYCTFSANPVGELMLRVFGLHNPTTAKYSDDICTGLQLANFWQDLSVDLQNGRCFIPKEILEKYDVNPDNYSEWYNCQNFDLVLNELYSHTENLFSTGGKLIKLLRPKRIRIEIEIIRRGGMLILKKTKALGRDILIKRPQISNFEFIKIAIQSLLVLIKKL